MKTLTLTIIFGMLTIFFAAMWSISFDSSEYYRKELEEQMDKRAKTIEEYTQFEKKSIQDIESLNKRLKECRTEFTKELNLEENRLLDQQYVINELSWRLGYEHSRPKPRGIYKNVKLPY